MTHHKHVLAVALLVGLAGLTTGASANQTIFVPLTLGAGLSQSGSFSDAIAASGSFTDDYLYASAPSFSLDSYTATAGSGVTFSSVTLAVYGTDTPVALTNAAGATAISTAPRSVLTSAIYVLEIKGVATAGSSYSGTINSTAVAAVPEPASWALMAVGLLATGCVVKRRG